MASTQAQAASLRRNSRAAWASEMMCFVVHISRAALWTSLRTVHRNSSAGLDSEEYLPQEAR